MQPEILIELVTKTMPFGKHKGVVYFRLPVSYVEWFYRAGLPPGKTGMLLATLYEIRLNGLEYILDEVKKRVASGNNTL
jgi:uncharacterized protein